MTGPARTERFIMPGFAAAESLLAAGVALGLLFISVVGPDSGDNYIRFAALGISASCIALALIAGLSQRTAKADVLVILAFCYFILVGVQEMTQSDILHAFPYLLGAFSSIGAIHANLSGLMSGLRRWTLIVIIAALLPAFVGQGFSEGRVWLGLLPGRYYGFSNPDALSFLAGLAILLSIPVLRSTRGFALAALGGLLFLLTATYTAAIATTLASTAYFFLIGRNVNRILQWFIAVFATLTAVALVWIPTDNAIVAFSSLHEKVSLTRRTFIWVELLQHTRGTGYFWTGLGDQAVARYTSEIMGVGSAHMTILQLFLSKGFIATAFFILVATIAAIRTLGHCSSDPGGVHRLAMAVVVYWFVTSLASTQPGTAMGFSAVIAIAISRSEKESKESLAYVARKSPLVVHSGTAERRSEA